MKKVHKVEKNFSFEITALAIIVRRDFTFDVTPLNIRSNWISLEGLNADRTKTKNKKLYRFLRAQNTEKKRAEQMKKIRVCFD
jgi:hypothetical protein